MAVVERRVAVLGGQRAELREQLVEAAVGDRVVAAGRRRHRREAHFPEPDLVGEVPVDARARRASAA